MLRQGLRWILYGNEPIFYVLLMGLIALLTLIGWLTLPKIEVQSNQLIIQTEPIPWDSLAIEHGVMIKYHDNQIVFSGNAQQVMQLCVQALNQYEQAFSFSLNKKNYKTFLVVDL
jgi:hypothetical protein